MELIFRPGWITCLNESMSRWFSKMSCPSWVFFPRKPDPFDNKYHTISCVESGIIFALEIVEGKDRPSEMPKPSFHHLGPTIRLLLHLAKLLYSTGKIVILHSGFCIL